MPATIVRPKSKLASDALKEYIEHWKTHDRSLEQKELVNASANTDR
jgi:hypothetical protein